MQAIQQRPEQNQIRLVHPLWIGVGLSLFLISCLFLGFLQIDLFIGESNSEAHHTMGTAVSQTLEPNFVRNHGLQVHLLPIGKDRFEQALLDQLSTKLQLELPADRIEMTSGSTEDVADQPLVLIEVSDWNVSWLPYRSKSTIELDVVYASDGDLSWRENKVFQSNSGRPTVQARGTVFVEDETTGLMTQSGYEQHLGKVAAAQLYQILRDPLFHPPR